LSPWINAFRRRGRWRRHETSRRQLNWSRHVIIIVLTFREHTRYIGTYRDKYLIFPWKLYR
jgi:hypothetical protein